MIIYGGNVKRCLFIRMLTGNKKGTRGAFMIFINPYAL
ncbi:hypothetical protein CSC02_3449 [Enterobacter hormaechei subsp. hoffmannii]|nr:hypothetical protein CSC02_3449 [Enterobacter hormaechei subsp. hoffmannii]